MYQYKMSDQVIRKPRAASGALRVSMVVFGGVFVLMGIMLSRGFMLPGFLLVGLYFIFDVFSKKEYEYILEGTEFQISVIYGKRYRRTVHTLDLKELEVVAPHWHSSVDPYRIRNRTKGSVRLKKFDYTSYEDEIPYYTMIISEEDEKIKILLDLKEEMLKAMKQRYPEKVFLE